MTTEVIRYVASPTIAKFHASDDFVRGVRGPVGSGKSVGCVKEIWKRMLEQKPNSVGIRKVRVACVRNTYPELKSTVIKTWEEWVPPSICPINYAAPISGKINERLPDGTTLQAEVLFLALDRPKDVGKLLSLELTMAWINEAKEIDIAIVDGVTQRVGRYPSMRDGGATWNGVIMDTNSPDDDHWWYHFEQEETPRKWSFYIQPPALLEVKNDDGQVEYVPNKGQGLYPPAENVANHVKGFDYWLDMIGGKRKNWIAAFVLNKFASVQDGKPVYLDDFNDELHVSKTELWPQKGLPVYLGFDFGLTPACIIGQITAKGQLRILDEVVAERSGFENFLKESVLPLLQSKYKDFQKYHWGDPSGITADDTNELSVYDIGSELGVEMEPAGSNDIEPRLEGVRYWLSRLVGRGEPAFLLSKHCTILKKGFISGYLYKRVQVSGTAKFRDVPDKNAYSHPHDALQYLCMSVKPSNTSAQQATGTTGSHVVGDSRTGY